MQPTTICNIFSDTISNTLNFFDYIFINVFLNMGLFTK